MLSLIQNEEIKCNEEARTLLLLEPKEYGRETAEQIINFALKDISISEINIEIDNELFPVKISVDSELKQIDYIFLKFTGKKPGRIEEQLSYKIVITAFESTYFLNTKLLGIKEFEEDPFDLVVKPPETVRVVKSRESSRIKPQQSKGIFKTSNQAKVELEILDLSPNSFSIHLYNEQSITEIYINETSFPVKKIREYGDISVYAIQNGDQRISFLNYLKYKSPALRVREECEVKEVLAAIERCGYFQNFNASNISTEVILNDFEELKKAKDRTALDICLMKNGKITGGSSILLTGAPTFPHQSWLLHQLYSDRNINTLDETGELYSWRAEYAKLVLKDNDKLIGWFKSSSRWLERIYVKYLTLTATNSLIPVHLLKVQIKAKNHDNPDQVIFSSGGASRVMIRNEYFELSISDRLSNASGLSNYIHVTKEFPINKLIEKASGVLSTLKIKEQYIYISIPQSFSIEPEYEKYVTQSDRYFEIGCSYLYDFISSIKYSIETTKRKKHEKTG